MFQSHLARRRRVPKYAGYPSDNPGLPYRNRTAHPLLSRKLSNRVFAAQEPPRTGSRGQPDLPPYASLDLDRLRSYLSAAR